MSVLIYDSSKLTNNQYLLPDSGVINSSDNGLINNITNLGTTSFFKCNVGDSITVDNVYSICFYDSNFAFIGLSTEATTTAPENVSFFRVCGWINQGKIVTVNIDTTLDTHNIDVIETKKFDSRTNELETKSGYTVYNGQDLAVTGSTCLVNEIPISYFDLTEGSAIRFHGRTAGGFLAWYNDNGSVVGTGDMRTSDFITKVPVGATKVRFAWMDSVGIDMYKIDSTNDDGGDVEVPTTHTVTNNLTNVNNSNPNTMINSGESYSATLTPVNGYVLDTVVVTMGGNDVTSIVYANNNITISSVSGDVVITASAELVSAETPNIVLSTTALTVNEASDSSFNVTLDKAPTSDVSLTVSVNNGYCSVDRNTLLFTGVNYNVAQTVTVTGKHDSANYNNNYSIITISGSNVSSKTLNVTVSNIDKKPATIEVNLTKLDYVEQGVETLIFDSASPFNFLATYENSYVAVNGGQMGKTSNCTGVQMIPVETGDVIRVTSKTGANFVQNFGAYYDFDKNFISGIGGQGNEMVLTIDDAKYIRFSYVTTAGLEIRITKASVSDRVSSGVYLDVKKSLYGNRTLESILNSYEECTKSKWNHKKWGLIGDSMTESNFRAMENYPYIIANNIHCKIINHGTSGYGFAQMVNVVKNLDADVDFITVFGGINNYISVHDAQPLGDITDTSSSQTVTGQLRLLIETILNKFPYTPVGFITPIPHHNGNSVSKTVNKQGYTLEQLADRIKEVCAEYSIPVLDLYRSSNLRPWVSSNNVKYFSCPRQTDGDGLHPNTLAHETILAPKIQSFIETL